MKSTWFLLHSNQGGLGSSLGEVDQSVALLSIWGIANNSQDSKLGSLALSITYASLTALTCHHDPFSSPFTPCSLII
jgi:hypothetical protein